MERLTGHIGKYVHIRACSSVYLNQERKTAPASNAVVRLAAIEDILGDEYDLDCLRDMIKAQDEGQAVVLRGDHTEADGEEALRVAMYRCNVTNNPVTRYTADAIAEKLARDEAETTLPINP